VKNILILTAGYGEGHNAAARGIRDGLARVAPDAHVDLRDLFAETFGALHGLIRQSYLTLINRWPHAWGYVYRWLDNKTDFEKDFRKFWRLKDRLARLLEIFQPHVVVSVFPAYPYLLNQISGSDPRYKNVVVVTDSITVNAIWYHCRADYFLLPNEPSAAVLRDAGVAPELIKALGFPVSPKFADLTQDRSALGGQAKPRVLYMITAGTAKAPELVDKLLDLDIELTVTVGRDEKLRRGIESVSGQRKIDIVGWTDEMPRMLCQSHVLIGKAGGASVQETIAARCPMIINHIVSGQEEGNARLIVETNSGTIALSNDEVFSQVQRAFADEATRWREWERNISALSRPRASLDIAEFLLSI
jgi:UDP-N-acetylglucosamine:LPS N-acetylglucosamine transferase